MVARNISQITRQRHGSIAGCGDEGVYMEPLYKAGWRAVARFLRMRAQLRAMSFLLRMKKRIDFQQDAFDGPPRGLSQGVCLSPSTPARVVSASGLDTNRMPRHGVSDREECGTDPGLPASGATRSGRLRRSLEGRGPRGPSQSDQVCLRRPR